jgi:HD-like signal output (HDOD) protein
MGLLNIEYVKPGMILAADLRTPLGRFFLPKGSAFTDESLRACKMWGVAAAEIEGVSRMRIERETLAAIAPEILSELKNRTRAHFAGCDTTHPAVRELARLHLVRHALRSLEAGSVPPLPPRPARPHPAAPGTSAVTPPSLAAIVQKGDQLFSLPAIFNKIVTVIRDPTSSASFIAEVIGKDQNLSAKLLRLVNSSYYGYPERVDSLSRAVLIVGSSRLTSLAVGILTMTLFRRVPRRLMDVTSFWSHGLACGVVARLLAVRKGNMEDEPLFVAGLLHDMGRMAYVVQYPELGTAALYEAMSRGQPGHAAESEIWGFDHAVLGGAMLASWKFPPMLIQAVARHHHPTQTEDGVAAALVHVADVIAHAMDHGGGQGFPVPPLSPAAFAAAGIAPGDLSSIVIQAFSQLDDITRIFLEES